MGPNTAADPGVILFEGEDADGTEENIEAGVRRFGKLAFVGAVTQFEDRDDADRYRRSADGAQPLQDLRWAVFESVDANIRVEQVPQASKSSRRCRTCGGRSKSSGIPSNAFQKLSGHSSRWMGAKTIRPPSLWISTSSVSGGNRNSFGSLTARAVPPRPSSPGMRAKTTPPPSLWISTSSVSGGNRNSFGSLTA